MTEEQVTQPLLAASASDRCVACGMPLSADQRYCVNCGERRGQARFSLPAGTPSAQTITETAVVAPPPAPRPSRASPGTTIVAGVGTLLLAMGVGVLIGRGSADTKATTTQAAQPTVVTVGGGGATGTAAAATSGTTHKKHSSSKSSKSAAKTPKNTAAKPTAEQAKKASDAASKVLGSSNKNLPPATVTVGQTGSGPGYNKKTHKFDGSFFGQ